jgi:hypothetical protein
MKANVQRNKEKVEKMKEEKRIEEHRKRRWNNIQEKAGMMETLIEAKKILGLI